MGKWEMVRLGDVFDLQMGKTPSRNNAAYWNDGIYKWISIADIGQANKYIADTKEAITQEAVQKTGIKLVPKDTVIMSFKLSLGKVAITSKNMYTNEAIMAFHNKGIYSVDIDYLYYLLRWFPWELNTNKAVMGATLNKATLSNIKIPLPPLDEQKRIAKNLDLASEIVKGYKEQLAELDKLVQSMFYEMFGDPVTNEKGWKIGTIRDVVREVKYGTSRPATKGGKYTYLRMNNITSNGHLDLSNLKQIDIPDNELEKYMVTYGDVLFNRTNSKELVGKTCVYNLQTQMIIAGYIIRVRVNEKMIPEFLSAILNSKYGKNTLYGMCKSIIGQANINAQELQSIKIYVPPLPLQTRFASIVTEIEAQKAQIQQALTEAETLFNSLMQEYFE